MKIYGLISIISGILLCVIIEICHPSYYPLLLQSQVWIGIKYRLCGCSISRVRALSQYHLHVYDIRIQSTRFYPLQISQVDWNIYGLTSISLSAFKKQKSMREVTRDKPPVVGHLSPMSRSEEVSHAAQAIRHLTPLIRHIGTWI